MPTWVRKTFIDFLPKFLFIQRPDPDPPEDDEYPEVLGGGKFFFGAFSLNAYKDIAPLLLKKNKGGS